MTARAECKVCGQGFDYAGRGSRPNACPAHHAAWRRELARRRTERWAIRKAAELAERAVEHLR